MISPIELDFISANSRRSRVTTSLRTFNSYVFDRNILVPASPFRFTAPGLDKDKRLQIRSGDFVTLWLTLPTGKKQQVASGFVDETDSHILPNTVEYIITGRDTVGQLVDNASVDSQNRIVNVSNLTLDKVLSQLLVNTRIPPGFRNQQVPNGTLIFNTNVGETKINSLQRYLDFTNCLIWSQPNGQLVLGKPNFAQRISGNLILRSSNPLSNNILECRVRRNLNQAIRQMVVQIQDLNQADAGQFTVNNQDQDMRQVTAQGVGRSVYNHFSYGDASSAVNTVNQVGNQSGNPIAIGNAYARRFIARENVKVLDVEAVVQGHINSNGFIYNIDQMYNVQIEDENISEDMYVYAVSYELTLQHGLLTRLRLCRKGFITADADFLPRTTIGVDTNNQGGNIA